MNTTKKLYESHDACFFMPIVRKGNGTIIIVKLARSF